MLHHVLSASLLLATAALAAESAPAKAHGGRSPDRFVARLEQELKLTPEQTVKARAVFAPAHVAARVEKGKENGARPGKGDPAKIRQARAHRGPMPFGPGLAAQFRADKIDTAALNKRWEERQAARRAGHLSWQAKLVELHAVLNPDQRAQLANLLEKKKGGTKKHHPSRKEDRG